MNMTTDLCGRLAAVVRIDATLEHLSTSLDTEGTAMAVPTGLSHIAMSVPPGTLTDEFRRALLDFYGELLGWREIDALRLDDRLTVSVGRHHYVNIRERPDPMVCSGYEHFGIVVGSTEEAERIWSQLEAHGDDVQLEPLERGDSGYRVFRFRYLLPLAVEIQYLP